MNLARARLQAVVAALLFSTGGAGIKVAAFSGPQVAAVRSGIAAIAITLWLRGRLRLSWRALGLGVIYACMITLFVNATKLTTAANAIFLQSAAPLYVMLLAPWLIGERLRLRDVVYMAAAGAGMVLCFSGRPETSALAQDPATGDLLAVLCGLTWALTLVGMRQVERDRAREGVGIAAVVIGNALACVGSAPFAWPLPSASVAEWGTLVYLGVCQIGLAYVVLTRAMQYLPALDASLLLLLEPVLNPLWTWIIRGEQPGGRVLAGGAVIVAASAIKSAYDARGMARLPVDTERAQRAGRRAGPDETPSR